MKKIAVTIVLVISSLDLLILLLKDFDDVKTFYALYYPEKYFVKDYLIYDDTETSSVNGATGIDDATYAFSGILEFTKIEYRGIVTTRLTQSNNRIPVWFCKLSKEAFCRTSEKVDEPFSFNMRDYFMGTLLSFLWLPNLLYYFYIRSNKKRLKTVLIVLISSYFLFLTYEIITNFTIIKSIYSKL